MGSFLDALNERRQQNWRNDYKDRRLDFLEESRQQKIKETIEENRFKEDLQRLKHEQAMDLVLEKSRLDEQRDNTEWQRKMDQWRREQDMKRQMDLDKFNLEWGPGGPNARKLPENQPFDPVKQLENEVKTRKLQDEAKSFAEKDAFGANDPFGGITLEDKMLELEEFVNGRDDGKGKNEGLIRKKEQIAKGDEHYGGILGIGSIDRRKEIPKLGQRVVGLLSEIGKMDPRYVTQEQKLRLGTATAQLEEKEIRQLFSISGFGTDDAIAEEVLTDMRAGEISPRDARIILQKLGIE